MQRLQRMCTLVAPEPACMTITSCHHIGRASPGRLFNILGFYPKKREFVGGGAGRGVHTGRGGGRVRWVGADGVGFATWSGRGVDRTHSQIGHARLRTLFNPTWPRHFQSTWGGVEGGAGQYIDRGLFPRFLDGWGLVELGWTRPQVEKCGK